MAILINVSPYLVNLSKLASHHLMQLLAQFTNYVYVLQDTANINHLIQLIQVIDHIICYRYDLNRKFVRELMSNAHQLNRIHKLNFSRNNIMFFQSELYDRYLVMSGLIKRP